MKKSVREIAYLEIGREISFLPYTSIYADMKFLVLPWTVALVIHARIHSLPARLKKQQNTTTKEKKECKKREKGEIRRKEEISKNEWRPGEARGKLLSLISNSLCDLRWREGSILPSLLLLLLLFLFFLFLRLLMIFPYKTHQRMQGETDYPRSNARPSCLSLRYSIDTPDTSSPLRLIFGEGSVRVFVCFTSLFLSQFFLLSWGIRWKQDFASLPTRSITPLSGVCTP